MEEINILLKDADDRMDKSVDHTKTELAKIRAGKAMPSMLDGLMVSYYGAPTPLSQVAAVNTADARTIIIKPWEKSMISEIEKAIINSDLGMTPQNDGEIVRLNMPMLTEERRKGMVKLVRAEIENGKVRIRNVRKEINDSLKKLQKDGLPEDAVKAGETQVQSMTDAHSKKLDELSAKKEAEIMQV